MSRTGEPEAERERAIPTQAESLELLKYRLAIRLALTDKLLLAVIVAVTAFFLNTALETRKADLQRQLANQRSQLDRQIEELKLQNARALLEAQTSQTRALESVKRDHQQQIEKVRGAQAEQLESLRAVIASRSSLGARRLAAYEAIYTGGVETSVALTMLAKTLSDIDVADIPNRRIRAILGFSAIWQKNRLFIGEHAVGKIEQFLQNVATHGVETGDAQALSQFQRDLENMLRRLRNDMQREIDAEQQQLRAGA